MAAPVYIDFVARGMPDIQRAFRSVHDTIAAGERTTTRVVSQGRSAKEREYQRLAREADRWAKQAQRDTERAEQAKVRARERAARAASQTFSRETREAERAEQAKVRAAEKSAAAIARIRERSATMAGQYAERQAREEARAAQRWSRGAARAEARQLRENERFGDRWGGRIMSATSNAVGMVRSGATRLAGTMMQLGGGYSLADSLSESANLERSAALLSNSAYLPGKNQRPDVAKIVAQARAASVATGLDANELVEGTRAYVAKSSDFAGGMGNMQFFGKLAKSSGTSFGDVAKTAGILRVQNKNLDESAMKQLLLDVVMQGKQGAVEFEDLARSAGKITRTSSSFAGNQTDNQRKLLGLAQIAIRTSGSVDESATVLSNLSADATKHADKVGAVIGKDFLNDRGQIAKGPEEFLADVMEKTGGNMAKIQSMGFGARSMKMFQALAPTFEEAETQAGRGTAAGRAAGRAAVLKDIGAVTTAKYDENTLEQDFGVVMKTSAEGFERAVRTLKAEVGDKLIPEFAKFIPIMQRLTPTLQRFLDGVVKVADWATEHPFAGLAAAVTLSITSELAKAAIGDLIKRAISGSLGGAGGGAAGAGGAAGGGVGAALGAGAAAGAATYLAVRPGVDAILSGQTDAQYQGGQLEAGIKQGGAAREEAIAQLKGMQDRYGGASGFARMYGAAAMTPVNAVYSAVTGEKNTSAEELRKAFAARDIIDQEGIKRAIADAVREGAREGAGGNPSTDSARDTNIVKRN